MKSFLFISVMSVSFSLAGQNFYNPLAIPDTLSGTNFSLTAAPSTHNFFGSVNTPTYGFNGSYLGPTLLVNKGDSVNISVVNNLTQSTTVHWHGLHIPAATDGGPHNVIPAGSTWQVGFGIRNAASTCWYHPHMHQNTGEQVNMGLAGMIIIRDTVEAQLNLPRTYGVDDIPLVLQDRSFNANGDFVSDGLSDSMLVNGTMHAYLDAPAQVVRMRLLNGSNVRSYNLGFSDNRTFYVIASDGGLLAQPYATTRLKISGGERYEILVDLSGSFGNSFYLMSYASQFANTEPGGGGMPNGNSPLNAVDFNIMQINVVGATANPVTTIPASLVAVNPWLPANANTVRYKALDGNGMFTNMANFTINNQSFDMMMINDTIPLNNLEVWQFTNNTNLAHPMHIHDVQFYVLSRNGNAPPLYESGLKDVFYIMPNEVVQVIMKFEDFADDSMPYMYHCHNLVHEDNGMMAQFIVVEDVSGMQEPSPVSFSFYPNPASAAIGISFAGSEEERCTIELRDAEGRLLQLVPFTPSAGNSTCTLDLTPYARGIYFLRVSGNQTSKTLKIVKE